MLRFLPAPHRNLTGVLHPYKYMFFVLAPLLAIELGCGGSNVKYENAEVSGRVMYKGKAVTGGRITFTSDTGGLAQGSDIEENGDYKVNAPVGPVHITIDNRFLEPSKRGRRQVQHPRKPGESVEPGETKGIYMPIPDKYYSIDKTDLTYTVRRGAAQTFEVELK
jgi:hypothetical protein